MFMVVPTAWAQENVVLPDLAPREVEITGDLTISFPSLRRQPLIGFNPPPRVPEIPASRRPFTEAYKQPSADLPPSPLRPPEPPSVSPLASRAPSDGYVSVAAGTWLDRSVEAAINLGTSVRSAATLEVDYFGTDGHESGPLNASSARDMFASRLGWSRKAGNGWLRLNGGLVRNAWSLFGAVPSAAGNALDNPDRTLTSWHSGISYNTTPGGRISGGSSVSFEHTLLETDVFDPAVREDPATSRTAQSIDLDAHLTVPVGTSRIQVKTWGSAQGFDDGSFRSLRFGEARALFLSPRDRILTLDLGGVVLGYDGRDNHLAYAAPVVRARYWLNDGLSVIGGTEPRLEHVSLRSVYEASPYLMDEPVLLPTMISMDAFGGIEFSTVLWQGTLKAGLRNEPNHRYVETPSGTVRGYQSGYFQTAHDEADVLYVSLDVGLTLSTAFQTGIRIQVQDTKLGAGDAAIPFVSPIVTRAWLASSFLDSRLLVDTSFQFESERSTRVGGAVDGQNLMLVEAATVWWFRPSLGASIGLRHLLSEPTFWPGYPLESNSISAGMRWRW